MQAQNKKNDIKSLSMGCRLNALESEKIQKMLSHVLDSAIILNSCAVTGEAERQSGQTARKLGRENPDVPIFVTGCAATRNPDLFYQIPNALVISNRDKLNLSAYTDALAAAPCNFNTTKSIKIAKPDSKLSKQFIQVQNGCNHKCAYCVTRLLRGPAISFDYADILADAKEAVKNGFYALCIQYEPAEHNTAGNQNKQTAHRPLVKVHISTSFSVLV